MSVSMTNESWFKRHYDMLSLILALIAVVASAAFLLVEIGKVQADLNQSGWLEPSQTPAKAERVELQPYQQHLASLKNPPQASEVRGQDMMVSELRIASINPANIPYPIPFDSTECPFTGHPQPDVKDRDSDGDGMSDDYENKHGLDSLNANDAFSDLDKDTYSNIDEFNAGTSPSDPSSFPPPIERLRMVRYNVLPFQLLFQGMNEPLPGMTNFVLNSRVTDKTYFVKMNESVLGHEIVDFKSIVNTNSEGIGVDVSELMLKRGEKNIKLVKNKPFSDEDKIGYLVWLGDGTPYKVKPGANFNLKGKEYKVVDFLPNRALIRDQDSGTTINVPKLTKAEYEDLTSNPESGGSSKRKTSSGDNSDSIGKWLNNKEK